ncbi:DUF1499 domain-containing protein [Falsochrobactrum sp. TDYN1]|uniref:DUF1499 domain-containing protein n=1 Tax=Falsochrobactrum tianjinense TaxID=2706015 RepID=A0A949PKG6_9HYPH|nr:DUF1499 domain-containing protein [Falsochrobactrum sp. TDYN1]MBV2142598.1 DUF1499 domain-containing protein [Falsochrobactrum sp. TDYN1]
MRKLRYQRRQSRSAIWALRFGMFSTVLLALGFFIHRFWVLETPDFVLVAGLSGVLALLALLCAVKGFRNLWINGDKGGARSFWGGFLAFVVLLPLCIAGGLWYGSPPLYDLATDFQAPPQFPAQMPERLPRMNSITAGMQSEILAQISAYPDVLGRRYQAAPDRVAQGVATALKAFGWTQISRDSPSAQQNMIRFAATAHSFILGLKSDVVIRLLDEGETTYVDMRSLSRYGKRDMGLNAAFITQFLAELEGEVNKAPLDVE